VEFLRGNKVQMLTFQQLVLPAREEEEFYFDELGDTSTGLEDD
jgi:hypothetical protein